MALKSKSFPELFAEAEAHADYSVAGAILEFTESLVREMERQGVTRSELARRIGVTPAYVTKILRGQANFTLDTMVRLARALGSDLHVQIGAEAGAPALPAVAAAKAR
jgi:transcriptional regulator with XRE-family HTH domain